MTVARRPARAGFTLLEVMIVTILAALAAVFAVPQFMRSRMTNCQQGNAGAALKQLATHEAVWRTQDTDRNGVADYWTRDVAAFHGLPDANGRPVAFIDLAHARADAAPGAAYAALGGRSGPKQGYLCRAMTFDQSRRPYVDPASPAPRVAGAPAGPCTHPSRFGFTAWPAVYGPYNLVYIINEDGVVWQKDPGFAAPFLHRAAAAPPGADTSWSQFGG